MKELVLEALRESVKRYPDLFEYIDGKAAWIIIRDDLLLWQAKAITQARNGEPALCEFDSAVIPSSIADMVKSMLAYADCEDCIKQGFSDVEAFMKAPDSKDKHKKLPPYTGTNLNFDSLPNNSLTPSTIILFLIMVFNLSREIISLCYSHRSLSLLLPILCL